MKKIYHLSHNDLDGYGAQVVTNEIFEKNNLIEVIYSNTNYGKEITENLEIILKDISKEDFLLITDINLSEEQAKWLEEKRIEINFELQLLDHHETGKNNTIYNWYYLDSSRCGTKITFDYFVKKDLIKKDSNISNIVDIINIYDLWQENHNNFEYGKILNQILYDNKDIFPKVLKNESLKYNLYLIKTFGSLISFFKEEKSIEELEINKYIIERKYFKDFFNEDMRNTPLHVLRIKYMYEKIITSDLKKEVFFDGYKFEVYYGLSSIFQEFSHLRLIDQDKEKIDFVVNINTQGFIGFRSKSPIKVNEFAKKYFNGGGHAQAAGGSLDKKENKMDTKVLFDLFMEQLNKERE